MSDYLVLAQPLEISGKEEKKRYRFRVEKAIWSKGKRAPAGKISVSAMPAAKSHQQHFPDGSINGLKGPVIPDYLAGIDEKELARRDRVLLFLSDPDAAHAGKTSYLLAAYRSWEMPERKAEVDAALARGPAERKASIEAGWRKLREKAKP